MPVITIMIKIKPDDASNSKSDAENDSAVSGHNVMLETLNAITDTYEVCEELITKINSDCRSFSGGGRLSAIFETTSLDIWNACMLM